MKRGVGGWVIAPGGVGDVGTGWSTSSPGREKVFGADGFGKEGGVVGDEINHEDEGIRPPGNMGMIGDGENPAGKVKRSPEVGERGGMCRRLWVMGETESGKKEVAGGRECEGEASPESFVRDSWVPLTVSESRRGSRAVDGGDEAAMEHGGAEEVAGGGDEGDRGALGVLGEGNGVNFVRLGFLNWVLIWVKFGNFMR
ncbi:hypothetical protein C2S52_001757 [Perilla frutescens var. hirtella]|nr:hypothetical protein C2S52_001757 [Perilla frutescens var. hirtella]